MNEETNSNQAILPNNVKTKDVEKEVLTNERTVILPEESNRKSVNVEDVENQEELNNTWVKTRYHQILKVFLSNGYVFAAILVFLIIIYISVNSDLLKLFTDNVSFYKSIGQSILNLAFIIALFLLLFPLTFKIREHFKSILDVILEYFRKNNHS